MKFGEVELCDLAVPTLMRNLLNNERTHTTVCNQTWYINHVFIEETFFTVIKTIAPSGI